MRVSLSLWFLLAVACFADDPSIDMPRPRSDPFAPGPYDIAYATGLCGNESKWRYDVWAPDTQGNFPVIVFITGVGGITPGSTYSNMTATVAAKGIVFITLAKLGLPEPTMDAALLAKALPWLKDNFPSFRLKAAANFDQLALSGHSAGNHVVCDYLQTECGMAKAVVMMDPVDGVDPFGIVKSYCITPGEKVNFTIPAILLRTGLDPVVKMFVACAPDDMANQRFYDAWAGPIWLANATKYGHVDLNNADLAIVGGLFCATDSEPNEPYHLQVAGLTHSFLSMVFSGDASAENVLLDASAMPVDTMVLHDYNKHPKPFSAGCTRRTEMLV